MATQFDNSPIMLYRKSPSDFMEEPILARLPTWTAIYQLAVKINGCYYFLINPPDIAEMPGHTLTRFWLDFAYVLEVRAEYLQYGGVVYIDVGGVAQREILPSR